MRVDEDATIATISEYYREGYLLDPHTAVGVKAAEDFIHEGTPMICLATAHPAKFGDAVEKAIGHQPDLPPVLANMNDRESRCEVLAAEVETVRSYLVERAV